MAPHFWVYLITFFALSEAGIELKMILANKMLNNHF